MTPKKVQKKRGGQRKHWAEKARVWIWYCYVKGCCNYSDYALDNEFAWTESGKASRSKDDDRPRTFECIRKFSRKPAGRDPRWRDINELVYAIDQVPIFNGTRAIYMSKFWDLLQEQRLTISSVKLEVEQILEANRLVRVDTRKSEFFSKMIDKYGQEYVFYRCLELSLNQMGELHGIVLTWLLYLQTEPIQNANVRKTIESMADSQLDLFFKSYYPSFDHLNNYSKAVGALLNLKLDMSETNMGGYGFLETYGVWPIVPLNMVDSISEKDLFSITFKPMVF